VHSDENPKFAALRKLDDAGDVDRLEVDLVGIEPAASSIAMEVQKPYLA
jgi:hypothetical protein